MRRSLKWQFFVSYLVIVIPLFIVLAVAFYATADMLEKEITYSSELRLKQVSDELENEMHVLRKMADRISLDRDLSRDSMARSEYYALKGIDALQRFNVGDDYLNEIGVCYQDKRLYTSRGMYSNNVYARMKMFFSEDDSERFERLLLERSGDVFSVFRNSVTGENQLMCAMSIPHDTPAPAATVLYELNMDFLRSKLTNLIGEYEGLAALTLDNTVIMSVGSGNSALLDEESDIEGSFLMQRSGDLGMALGVTLGVEIGEILRPVILLRTVAMLALTIGLLVVLVICYRLSVRNYHPIKNIAHMLGVSVDKPTAIRDMEVIHEAIDKTMEQKRVLTTVVDENRKMLRVQCCAVLFHGLETDDVELRRMLRLAQFDMPEYPLYACAMVQPCVSRAGETERICAELLRRFPLSIGWQTDEKHAIALAVGLDMDQDVRDQVEELRIEINIALNKMGCTSWRLGLGQGYPSLSMIHRSLTEAAAALRADRNPSSRVVLFSELIGVRSGRRKYDTPWVDRMSEALYSKNLDAACNVLNELCVFMTSEPKAEMRQRDCYSLIHALCAYMMDAGIEQQSISELMHLDVGDLVQFEERISVLLRDILSKKPENVQDAGPFAEIITYIKLHYADQNMSLDVLSEQFHISKTHISRLFKENLQKTYLDYLAELRIAQARRLLKESNLSVRAIVESVGYVDIASFNRKFKKYHGISPTDYRKNYRQDQSSETEGE